VWDLATESTVATLQAPYTLMLGLAWSPDGRLLAAAHSGFRGSSRLQLWSTAAWGEQLAALPVAADYGFGIAVGLSFSPDGRLLAAPSGDAVRVWDVASRGVVGDVRGHSMPVRWAAFSPDGRRLASAAADGTGRVWAVSGGEAGKS
jgi:WD40 repeat protein